MSNLAKIAALLREIGELEHKISKLKKAHSDITVHNMLRGNELTGIEIVDSSWRDITTLKPKEILQHGGEIVERELQKSDQALSKIDHKITELEGRISQIMAEIASLKFLEGSAS